MTELTQAVREQVLALEEERAFADRSAHRKILVTGADAEGWLNDLLTAGLVGLVEGQARRSLLLTPTGRLRADVTVSRTAEGYLLLQDPRQPESIDGLLAPYVLSSDVTLEDRSDGIVLISLPGSAAARVGWPGSAPSVLGEGEDLLASPDTAYRIESMLLKKQLTEVGDDALEVWRIRRGVARFPVDLNAESLPAEGGLEHLIDTAKGCFLGQESVAKVRNLGHPPRVVRGARTYASVAPGDGVFAGPVRIGEVTSAVPAAGGGTACVVRISWAGAEEPATTPDGTPLLPLDGTG